MNDRSPAPAAIAALAAWVLLASTLAVLIGASPEVRPAGASPAEDCADPGNTFSFFSWSDSYTSAGDGGVIRVFDDAVDRARYPGRVIPRFWIACGDIPFMSDGNGRLDQLNDEISNSPSGQRYPFACSLSNGKFPYFVAIGNHDIDGYDGLVATTPQSQYDYWSNVVGPRLPSTLVGISSFQWGPDSGYDARTTYSFDYKNAHIVVVNQYDGDPAYPTDRPVACIRPALHEWLDRDLALTRQPVKLVFGHEPAWSYCSNVAGYGGEFCPLTNIDNQSPASRPRPYSTTGSWTQPFGEHWGDSLESQSCPPGSRDAFWSMLARHGVVAHVVGHTHTYSGRLIQGDGTRRNDVSAYGKTGQTFDGREGVWEVNTGQVHNSAGAAYVLTTVRENVVTFEAYDQIGMTEPFRLVESWSVRVGNPPSVEITTPAEGASFIAPATIAIAADAFDSGGSVAQVAFYANGGLIGVATAPPFQVAWSGAPAGAYALTAIATDNDGETATAGAVNVTVNPDTGNRAPVLAPIADRGVDEQAPLRFTAEASDPDAGDALSFSLVGAPSGATIGATSGAFDWTPGELQGPGTYRFTVRVRDSASPSASADDAVVVTVSEVNQAPVLAPIGDQTVIEGTPLAFTAAASDDDVPVNGLAFSLVGAPAGASIHPGTGAFSWTPTDAQGPGSYAFAVRVTDGGLPALSADQPVTVTVADRAPDLVVSDVSTAATAVLPGQDITISHTVRNQGVLSAGSFAIAFHLSPDAAGGGAGDVPIVKGRSVNGLAAGASSSASTKVAVASTTPLGTYHVCATADASDAVPEGIETNNARCTAGTIVVGRPDLTLTQLLPGASTVRAGARLTVTDAVKNEGPLAAASSKVAYRLSTNATFGDGDDIALGGTRNVSSLAPGASNPGTIDANVPNGTPPGDYYLFARADATDAVVEADESDNTRIAAARVTVIR